MAMLKRLHPFAGAIGFLTILVFWTSTVASELSGSTAAVIAVKTAIPWGFLILIPALALAGATGFLLGKGRKDERVARKRRRMPFIAANGIVILIPAAFTLSALAARGDFGLLFYAIQAVELVAGGINLILMGSNIRDGLRISGRWK
jgi:hypothetical protein